MNQNGITYICQLASCLHAAGTMKAMEITYVHKFLADAGMGSRRKMVEAMKEGKVKVNGKTTQDPRFTIDPAQDEVKLLNQIVVVRPAKIYLMLHKPVGVITTADDEQNRKTVVDLLPSRYKELRLFPIGRLDQDTEGLLILTNDGELAYKLTHPKFEHEKEYEVTIGAALTTQQLKDVRIGMLLEDGRTAPARIKQIHVSQHVTYSMTIHEGRKRQIRRMFERLGFRVIRLKRIRIGGLILDRNLKAGWVRELSATELEQLQQINGKKRTLKKADKKLPVQSSRQAIKSGKLKVASKTGKTTARRKVSYKARAK